MKKNILNIVGMQLLSRNVQKQINGGLRRVEDEGSEICICIGVRMCYTPLGNQYACGFDPIYPTPECC